MKKILCPNPVCQKEVEIIEQHDWKVKINLYIPACPHCAHSFRKHFSSLQDLAIYIGYDPTKIIDITYDDNIIKEEQEW